MLTIQIGFYSPATSIRGIRQTMYRGLFCLLAFFHLAVLNYNAFGKKTLLPLLCTTVFDQDVIKHGNMIDKLMGINHT